MKKYKITKETTHHDGSYDTMRGAMKEGAVFSVSKRGDKFWIQEECDGHFSYLITAAKLANLGQELFDLTTTSPTQIISKTTTAYRPQIG